MLIPLFHRAEMPCKVIESVLREVEYYDVA